MGLVLRGGALPCSQVSMINEYKRGTGANEQNSTANEPKGRTFDRGESRSCGSRVTERVHIQFGGMKPCRCRRFCQRVNTLNSESAKRIVVMASSFRP